MKKKHFFPGTTQERHVYSLRNNEDIDIPKAATESYLKSFFPAASRDWNTLDAKTKSSKTVDTFKLATRPSHEKKKYYYNSNRKGEVLHIRLKTRNADLNENLFLKNLKETQECACGEPIESTRHYLTYCKNFTAQREALFSKICTHTPLRHNEITSEILLNGCQGLIEEQNKIIIKETIKYIMITKRFK